MKPTFILQGDSKTTAKWDVFQYVPANSFYSFFVSNFFGADTYFKSNVPTLALTIVIQMAFICSTKTIFFLLNLQNIIEKCQ